MNYELFSITHTLPLLRIHVSCMRSSCSERNIQQSGVRRVEGIVGNGA